MSPKDTIIIIIITIVISICYHYYHYYDCCYCYYYYYYYSCARPLVSDGVGLLGRRPARADRRRSVLFKFLAIRERQDGLCF